MTEQANNSIARLEEISGLCHPINGTASIGRTDASQIVLPDQKVSRRHAMVHVDENGEYWLVDFGSSNGTYHNGRRVTQPIRLCDGDKIEIGHFHLFFRLPGSPQRADEQLPGTDRTIHDIKSSPCWLLVADIEGSTQLIKKLAEDELPMITSQWLVECKRVVEECGGEINKFLGDGFFAYWNDRPDAATDVIRALNALKILQEKANPCFRLVLHFGTVFMGGAASMGEESLLGKEVNFIFRLEKLAGSLGARRLMSETAQARIGPALATTDIGRHPVQSFEGEFALYSF